MKIMRLLHLDWRVFLFGSNSNNSVTGGSFAVNKDKRMDINNGITLCNECHRKIHNIYGDRTIESNLKIFLS